MSTSLTPTLRGLLSPVLTPFEADGAPSVPRFIEHCRTLLNHDVGLAIFGTNSEATSMSVREKRALLDAILAAGMPAARMMPGVGACNLDDTVELACHAVAAGGGGVLMLPPFFYKGVSEEGLFRSFAGMIDAVGDARLRVYLYHIPPVTQVGISLSLIERLLKAFAGSETCLVDTMRHGGAGVISATANVNPGGIAGLLRDWQHDDADARQAALNQVRATFGQFPMIAAMKAAMASGLNDPAWNKLRAPLVELDRIQRETLLRQLDALSFRLYRGQVEEAAAH